MLIPWDTTNIKLNTMNKILYFFAASALIFASCDPDETPIDQSKLVSIDMGAHQASDVYYSFENGEVLTTERNQWDIAFSVPLQTAAIRINEGAGIRLFIASNDTADWATLDTSDFSSWEAIYNSSSNWLNGAFNRNATENPFNFGWATYDFTETHTVWGEFLYVIRLSDNSYKKLFIRKRIGMTDTYEIRWANIDGAEEVNSSIEMAQYSAKHFIHFSLGKNAVLNVEPASDTWDLLFTKYIEILPAGPGIFIPYPVMGVLLNQNHQGLKVTEIAVENSHYSDNTEGFIDDADVIGWEFKVSDPVTHAVSLADSTSYFVKLSSGEIHKLYFTEYGGESAGTMSFKTEKID